MYDKVSIVFAVLALRVQPLKSKQLLVCFDVIITGYADVKIFQCWIKTMALTLLK